MGPLSKVLFRLLLIAHPRATRRRYGAEMLQTFAARNAALRRGRGLWAVLARYPRELAGIVAAGIAARRQQKPRALSAPRRATRSGSLPAGSIPEKGRGLAMDPLAQDFRYAIRTFAKNPAFTAAAIVAIALGIGANTAIFSVVNAVILRPLPFTQPARLVAIWEQNPDRGWYKAQVAAANYLDWREQSSAFDGIGANNDWLLSLPMTSDGEPEMVHANQVTGNLCGVLGVAPLIGPGFDPADSWAEGEPKVVLSHAFWVSHFAVDPAIVGSRITLAGVQRTVAGVMPAGFSYSLVFTFGSGIPDIDVWLPMEWPAAARQQVSFRRAHGMSVVGRLADGVGIDEAETELAAIARRLASRASSQPP